jgi:hypothetical protein
MDDQNQNDELYPIAVLIDELKVRITILPCGGSEGSLMEQKAYLMRGYSMMTFFSDSMPFEGCPQSRWRLVQSGRETS